MIDPARLDSAVRTVALRRAALRGFRWRRALLRAWAVEEIGRETLLEIRDEYRHPCALRP